MEQRLIDANEIEWYGCNFEGGRACVKANGDCNSCSYAECSANQVRNLPTVNAIVIPDNATWGEVIEAVFPNIDKAGVLGEYYRIFLEGKSLDDFSLKISEELWNSPYKRGE